MDENFWAVANCRPADGTVTSESDRECSWGNFLRRNTGGTKGNVIAQTRGQPTPYRIRVPRTYFPSRGTIGRVGNFSALSVPLKVWLKLWEDNCRKCHFYQGTQIRDRVSKFTNMLPKLQKHFLLNIVCEIYQEVCWLLPVHVLHVFGLDGHLYWQTCFHHAYKIITPTLILLFINNY